MNEEGQYFDDQLNKAEDNMTGISFLAIKRNDSFTRIVAKTCILIAIFK